MILLDELKMHGFTIQPLQHIIYSKKNGYSRVYVYSDYVVKVKKNKCWLSHHELTNFKLIRQTSSISTLNKFINFDHGKQIIIRYNNFYIWTIQKRCFFLKEYYHNIYFSNIRSIIAKKYLCDQIFKCVFSCKFYLFRDMIDEKIKMPVFISNKYILYDINGQNFAFYSNQKYFISDIEVIDKTLIMNS